MYLTLESRRSSKAFFVLSRASNHDLMHLAMLTALTPPKETCKIVGMSDSKPASFSYSFVARWGLYSRVHIHAGRTARATDDPMMSMSGHHRNPSAENASQMVVAPYPVMPSAALMTANRSAHHDPRSTLVTPITPDTIMAMDMVCVSGVPAAWLMVFEGLMMLSAPNAR